MRDDPEIRRVYYDSFFPMEVALGGRMADHGKEMFSQVRSGPYAVVISQVVVGETHTVIIGRYHDRLERVEMIARLEDAILSTGVDTNTDVRIDSRGGLKPLVPEDVLEVMAGLLVEVPELDGTDLVILAIALADPYSAYLITWDHVLLENKNIDRYERRLRKEGKRKVRLRIAHRL